MHQHKIRLVLVDDNTLILNEIMASLSMFEDFELVGQGKSGLDAIALCNQHQPDVVLMDIVMPIMDGIRATKEILARHPAIKIIALSGNSDAKTVQEMISAGAVGYIVKDSFPEHLTSTIRAVYSGKSVFSTDLVKALFDPANNSSPPQTDYDLTRRETEILHYMVEGKTNPEIAQVLSISLATTKFHISNILRKLDVNTRSAAISLAVKEHLI